MNLSRKQINLIASYEQAFDIPSEERVTEYTGVYALKQGAPQERIDLTYNCALSELGVTEETFLSDSSLEYYRDILSRFRSHLDVCLTNVGAYAAGELKCEWLRLPTDRATLQSTFEHIGLSEGGEYFITDYSSILSELTENLGEYENLNELNYLAAKLQEMSKSGDLEMFSATLHLGKDTGSVKDLINLTDNLDRYSLFPEITDQEALGRYVVENGAYDLEAMGELADYIDYESLGRDTQINEGGIFTEQGYIVCDQSRITEYYESVKDIPQEYLVTPDMTETAAETMTETAAETMMMG